MQEITDAHFQASQSQTAAGCPDRISLRQRHGLFANDATQMQDDGFLDTGDIHRQRLVERIGAVLVVEGGGDGPALSLANRRFGPGYIRAAAGGNDLIDGDGLFSLVGHREGAGLRAVRREDVAEIVDDLVEDHIAETLFPHLGGDGICHNGRRRIRRRFSRFRGRTGIGTGTGHAENGKGQKGKKRTAHDNLFWHILCKVKAVTLKFKLIPLFLRQYLKLITQQ